MFQSPSHRGWDRSEIKPSTATTCIKVSIPFASGLGPVPSSSISSAASNHGFNPLRIGAGTGPATTVIFYGQRARGFNPLRIGAGTGPGRFVRLVFAEDGTFQSPSHRGWDRSRGFVVDPELEKKAVSIPFASGLGPVHTGHIRSNSLCGADCFNPLRIGAGTGPLIGEAPGYQGCKVSIPFASGQGPVPGFCGYFECSCTWRFNPLRIGAGTGPLPSTSALLPTSGVYICRMSQIYTFLSPLQFLPVAKNRP